jgi:hypothetical protein
MILRKKSGASHKTDRTSRKDLLPDHPHGQRMATIFTHGWKWLEAPNECNGTDWKTVEKYPLKPRVLWSRHQDAGKIIGVRFGSSTNYALLDIDEHSPYLELLPQIEMALETIGIVRTIPLRSSWSGGIHLYIPLPQKYPTFSVACAVQQCLEAQGFAIAPGQLEVFPNVKEYGRCWLGEFTEYNGHRLPLQPATGSCLLDSSYQPMGTDLAVFFALWDNAVAMNDPADISEALSIARTNRRRRGRKATGPAQEWREDLEAIIREGWTGRGQTNRLLKEIATYGRVFERLSGIDLQVYVLQTATKAPGYERWCNHQHEIGRRCDAWAMAVEKYYWPLGDEPLRERKPFKDICAQRAADARARIKEAMTWFRFDDLGIKELAIAICDHARCSLQTLYKNCDVWHPEGQKRSQRVTDRTASDSDELAEVQRLCRESLESVGIGSVTRSGGENEACSLKSPPSKKLIPGAERGVAGEREGVSTGWLPPLNWQEGAVNAL